MSPFHDLAWHGGEPPAVARASHLPSSARPPPAGGEVAAGVGIHGISLTRFAWVLALTVLGLAGLLFLGVGGLALVQRDLSAGSRPGIREPRAPSRHGETPPSRAIAEHGSSASGKGTAGRVPRGVADGARRPRPTPRSGPAAREAAIESTRTTRGGESKNGGVALTGE